MCRHRFVGAHCLLAASLLLGACERGDSTADSGDVWQLEDTSAAADSGGPDGTRSDAGCDEETQNCSTDAASPCENRTPTDEVCNGKDDDCDGDTDENLTKKCERQKGVCEGATTTCTGGSYPSCGAAQYGDDYEKNEVACDGKDNDCDGTTDPMSDECGWTRMVGGDQTDGIEGVAATSEGGVYAAGATGTSLDGQMYAGGKGDAFLARFSSAGDSTWTRLIGSSELDKAFDVTATDSGAAYVAGFVGGEVHGRSPKGGSDAFLTKYDADGARQWTRLSGAKGADGAQDVALDDEGNAYLTGAVRNKLHGQSYNGGRTDGYLVKFDPNGNRVWTRLVGTSGRDRAYAVATDGGGNIYVAGSTSAGLNGQSHAGAADGFLVKFDGDGARSWTRLIGSPQSETAEGLAVSARGDIYVSGQTTGELHGRPYEGGSDDGFLVQYTQRGARNWTRLFGSSGTDIGFDVASRKGEYAYVVGRTDGDFNGRTYLGGFSDGFVVKFDASGAEQSTELIGTPAEDRSEAVALDGQNHPYIGGLSDEGLNGRPYNGGGLDGFLIRQF